MIISRYKTSLAQAVTKETTPTVLDTFGTRSYQVLVRDEMVFAPTLSSETLLLDAIKRLQRPIQKN